MRVDLTNILNIFYTFTWGDNANKEVYNQVVKELESYCSTHKSIATERFGVICLPKTYPRICLGKLALPNKWGFILYLRRNTLLGKHQ